MIVTDFLSLSISTDIVEYLISFSFIIFFLRLFSLIPVELSILGFLIDFSSIKDFRSSFNVVFFKIVSTSRHSKAFLALTPSSIVQNTSARSLLIFLLSVSLVKPPVPGRTARSGTSGNDILEEPSSIKII